MGVRTREKVEGSGVWWVFISHQGRRTSRKVGDRKAAREAARKIQARLTLGKGAFGEKAKPPAPKLRRYFKRFEANYKSTLKPSSWLSYEGSLRIHILPELGKYRLDEITKPMMKQLVVKMVEEGLAKDSIRLYLTSLGVLYNQAIDDKVVSENPTKGLGKFYRQAKRKHEEISPLTEEESLLFLEKTLEYERKHYPLFLCALYTGMRSGELAGIQWTDIDWNGKFIEVRRAMNRFGEVSTVKTRNFKKVLKKAGLRSIRFHDLRHTFASQLLSNGTNILYVSQQLGHSNPGITMKIYAKWIPNEGQRQAMINLPYVGRLCDKSHDSQEEKVAV